MSKLFQPKSKPNDAKIQSLSFKFTFKIEIDQLFIQATNSENNQIFYGTITTNPYVEFDMIKQLLEEGQYKIINKTEDLLKIRIGATLLQLLPKQKYQINDLKDTIKKSLQKQNQFQKIIQTQNNIIDKQVNLIANLRETFQRFVKDSKINHIGEKSLNKEPIQLLKWSLSMKSESNAIYGNVTTKIKDDYTCGLCLLDIRLSNKKQYWGIKFVKGSGKIGLGICLQKIVKQNKFEEKPRWSDKTQGCYLIRSNGQNQCHTSQSIYSKLIFKPGDIINLEYDPISLMIKFRLNEKGSSIEMSIIPPIDDTYHPFVSLQRIYDTVEIVQYQESSLTQKIPVTNNNLKVI